MGSILPIPPEAWPQSSGESPPLPLPPPLPRPPPPPQPPRPQLDGYRPKPLFTTLAFVLPALFIAYGFVQLVQKSLEEPEFGPMAGAFLLLLNLIAAGITAVFFGCCAFSRGECLRNKAVILVPICVGGGVAVVIGFWIVF
jgi:hypothetical protein